MGRYEEGREGSLRDLSMEVTSAIFHARGKEPACTFNLD